MKKQASFDHLQIIIIILIICLQVYLCFTMRIQLDEPTYSALGYRFATGTRMFVDEWHISQMFGFLNLPFVQLFMQVTGGTDGIVLFLRFCYLIMSIITFFLFMKKYGSYPNAFEAGIMIMLFAPLNMMSLSYNTIGIHALLQAHCLRNTGNRNSFLAGVLFSCAVLSTPYLVILFAGCLIYEIFRWKERSNKKKSECLWFLAGIGAMVLLFCIFVFHNSSISEVVNGLLRLPSRNQNHFSNHNPVLLTGYRFVLGGWQSFGPFIFLQFLAMVAAAISRNPHAQKACNLLGVVSVAYFMARQIIAKDTPSISNLFLPVALASFPMMLKEKDSQLKSVYFLFLLDAFFFGFSSNLGLKSFSQALVVSDAAVFMASREKKMKWISIAMAAFALILHTDPVTENGAVVLKNGPMKGIKVPEDYAEAYSKTIDFLKQADSLTMSGQYYLVTDSPWQHMILRHHNSLNFSTFQDTVSKEEYIDLFNENLKQKQPDNCLLILSNSYQGLEISDFDLSDYKISSISDQVWLLVRNTSE